MKPDQYIDIFIPKINLHCSACDRDTCKGKNLPITTEVYHWSRYKRELVEADNIDCLTKICSAMQTREEYIACMYQLFYHVIQSNAPKCIKYFYPKGYDWFQKQTRGETDEPKWIHWEMSQYQDTLLSEMHKMVYDSNTVDFLVYSITELREKLTCWNSFVISIVRFAIGHTNCYWGLHGKDGDFTNFKKMIKLKPWNHVQDVDADTAKEQFFSYFFEILDTWYREDPQIEQTHPINYEEGFWREFFDEYEQTLEKYPHLTAYVKAKKDELEEKKESFVKYIMSNNHICSDIVRYCITEYI